MPTYLVSEVYVSFLDYIHACFKLTSQVLWLAPPSNWWQSTRKHHSSFSLFNHTFSLSLSLSLSFSANNNPIIWIRNVKMSTTENRAYSPLDKKYYHSTIVGKNSPLHQLMHPSALPQAVTYPPPQAFREKGWCKVLPNKAFTDHIHTAPWWGWQWPPPPQRCPGGARRPWWWWGCRLNSRHQACRWSTLGRHTPLLDTHTNRHKDRQTDIAKNTDTHTYTVTVIPHAPPHT